MSQSKLLCSLIGSVCSCIFFVHITLRADHPLFWLVRIQNYCDFGARACARSSLASQPYFFRWEEREGEKNTEKYGWPARLLLNVAPQVSHTKPQHRRWAKHVYQIGCHKETDNIHLVVYQTNQLSLALPGLQITRWTLSVSAKRSNCDLAE